MAATRGASAASRVFVAFLGAVVVITALLAVLLAFQAQATERAEAEAVTLAVARTIAEMPDVEAAVTAGSDAAAPRRCSRSRRGSWTRPRSTSSRS